MKQKDLIVIGAAIFVSIIVSLVISNKIFTSSTTSQQVQVIQPISTAFPKPDPRYFNDSSIDPTQLITVSPNNNNSPISGSQ